MLISYLIYFPLDIFHRQFAFSIKSEFIPPLPPGHLQFGSTTPNQMAVDCWPGYGQAGPHTRLPADKYHPLRKRRADGARKRGRSWLW